MAIVVREGVEIGRRGDSGGHNEEANLGVTRSAGGPPEAHEERNRL
jgi:hypothetical protein